MKTNVAIPNNKSGTSGTKGTLGTFAGVFTPSILTILGIILFLRLGYVVGNAGLGLTLVILLLANGISVLTSVSLSAISTNLKVKGGGDYYLISRTLGLEFGGAIGIVVFLAQAVSIAFYCLGFGEALAALLPNNSSILPQIIAALAVSFLFIFAWLGADWATKFQYVVMGILAAAILSFFIGGFVRWDTARLIQNWASPQSNLGFWVLFAIFFPAVTGFTQGVSMSGDLRDPGKSLPRGTFTAVGVSIVVYILSAVIFAAALPADIMMSDYGAMKKVAVIDFLVTAGVIAATLSSAMASFLGAPRILQSLAGDRTFPFLVMFAKGSGPAENPRRGVLLAACIAYITIAYGRLNLIAPVVSMFFLISYGLLNYATYYEARSASPSFRPRFRYFNKWISLVGALACLGTMLAVGLYAGIVAVAVLFAIFQYLKRTAGPSRWADSRRSYHLQLAREHLLAAAEEPEHPRYWRPQILAFSNNPERRAQLLRFSSWIEGGSGITTAVRILEGQGLKMRKMKEEAQAQLQRDIIQHGARAFPLVVAAPNHQIGIQAVVQAYGVGSLKANTIILNWLGQVAKKILSLTDEDFGKNLRWAHFYGCNIVILDAKTDKWTSLEETDDSAKQIDIWWWGDATSRLMLLIAYLMTRHELWNEAKIRLLAADINQKADQSVESLKAMLEEVRIEAEPEIVEDVSAETIAEYSAGSSVVFLPFRIKNNQVVDPLGNSMESTIFLLPVVAMVMAAEDIDLDAEPEEGKAAEMAQASDALEDAEKKAQAAEKEAEKAIESAERAKDNAENLMADPAGVNEDLQAKAEKTARDAEKQANKMSRKAAKAAAKAETAALEAEAAGVLPEKPEVEKPNKKDASPD
ncbi:MAG: amino acid permease [Thermodesulfobacteriota bacterium]|nr:amino acid permease [Thermodesulfobacteriota bacterium]